jgi:DNA processing protein
MKADLEALLSLYSVPLLGPKKIHQLIAAFGTAEKVLAARPGVLQKIPGIGRKIAANLRADINKTFIEQQFKAIDSQAQQVITFWDDDYPPLLKKIYDPPLILFYRGNIKLAANFALAIVGTRNYSPYGDSVLRKIIPSIKAYPVTIVSGLARGIDTIAHQLSLKNGLQTIAVLGNGLDKIYPPENIDLWKKLEKEHLLLTEYPWGNIPDAGNFPRRNRIISGLSRGVVVIEAAAKSGALITADYALEQNRDVFAVPGPITQSQSEGTNQLITEGAIPLTGESILTEWLSGFEQKAKNTGPGHSAGENPPDLKGLAAQVYSLLHYEPVHIDRLALECRASIAELAAVLLELELSDIIRQLPGKFFVRL